MKDNIKLKKVVRVLLALVSTCFVIVMVWILVDCFTSKKLATQKVITYRMEDSVHYDVTLKDNNYFVGDDLKYYPTELMDKIDVSFNYDLMSSSYFDSNYTYDVVAYLQSKVDGEVIWKKEESILDSKNYVEDHVMSIRAFDIVTIDINHFYELANDFYNLTGNDVDLVIDVNVGSKLKVDGYSDSVEDRQVLSLSFPITKKIVKINSSNGNSINKKVFSQYQVNKNFNSYLFILAALVLVSLLPIAIMSYASLFNLINLDDYNRKLKVIRKKYKYLIKEVTEEPVFKDKEVLEAQTYSEVVNICNDKDLSLNLYERIAGHECWLYVEDDDKVILYVLTLDYNEIDLKDNSKVIHINKKKSTKKDK